MSPCHLSNLAGFPWFSYIIGQVFHIMSYEFLSGSRGSSMWLTAMTAIVSKTPAKNSPRCWTRTRCAMQCFWSLRLAKTDGDTWTQAPLNGVLTKYHRVWWRMLPMNYNMTWSMVLTCFFNRSQFEWWPQLADLSVFLVLWLQFEIRFFDARSLRDVCVNNKWQMKGIGIGAVQGMNNMFQRTPQTTLKTIVVVFVSPSFGRHRWISLVWAHFWRVQDLDLSAFKCQ